jgi:hypothetical protein
MMDPHKTADQELSEKAGHEVTDAEAGPLVKFVAFLALTTAITAAVVVGLYKYLDTREIREKAGHYPLAVGIERPLPPSPRLQSYPLDDMQELRKNESLVLDHYGWVDKSKGVVRIPVDRAIELLATRGLPHRQAPAAPTAAGAPAAPGDH